MNRSDFYSTASQVLPLMTLAFVLELRQFASHQDDASRQERSAWLPAAGAVLVMALMVCGEAAALTGLVEGDRRELRDAVATALYGGAVILCLALINVSVGPLIPDRHRTLADIARNAIVVVAVAVWLVWVA